MAVALAMEVKGECFVPTLLELSLSQRGGRVLIAGGMAKSVCRCGAQSPIWGAQFECGLVEYELQQLELSRQRSPTDDSRVLECSC